MLFYVYHPDSFKGTFVRDETRDKCAEAYLASDGRSIKWRPERERWCFRLSSTDVDDTSDYCAAFSYGDSDDLSIEVGAQYVLPATLRSFLIWWF
jgi:hypothetical protein